MKFSWFLLFPILFGGSLAANILFLDVMFSKSINMWNRVLMEALAIRGHNLTVVSAALDLKSSKNIHYIYLEKAFDILKNMDFNDMSNDNIFSGLMAGYTYNEYVAQGIVQSDGVQTILNYPDSFKFDLVLYDFIGGPVLLPLIQKFNYPPMIGVAAFDNCPFRAQLIGGHQYAAYNPHYFFTYDVLMNFVERFWNTILHNFDLFYRDNFILERLNLLAKKTFNYPNQPHLRDLERKTSLILTGSDYSITPPFPKLPNEIFVGGLQIVEPKPLPKDLEFFMRTGKKGTILMSLGTNVRSDSLDKKDLIIFIKTFESLPDYNFLWKFESDSLPIELPKNVKIEKFLPQNDLLAHPNLKAFITHAGSLSTQEALWYGVPCVAMPFFLDQFKNAMKMVKIGVAEYIDKDKLTVTGFREAILKILEDPSILQNASKISRQFQDQPEKPLERAVWWTEYILRNPNPTHLRSPTMDLGDFISNSYDVLVFILLIGISGTFFIVICLKKLFYSKKVVEKIKKN